MNGTYDYPLSNDYMWFKMILESFKDQTNKNEPLGYFTHQFNIRKDVYDQTHFFKLCKEHTTSLKEAFEVILTNNSQLPNFPNSIVEQVYKCDFVFGYDKKSEWANLTEEKKALIEIKDFDNIIEALGTAISQSKKELIKEPKKEVSSRNPKSFKYINIATGSPNLTDLMKRLKEKNLIANDTTLATFRKVFSGGSIDKPIVWNGNLSELSYLVKQLHNELKLVEDLKQKQWAVTINCFVDAKGQQFDRKKLKGQKVPVTSGIIDSLLKTLK
jgi:hypothetical protein